MFKQMIVLLSTSLMLQSYVTGNDNGTPDIVDGDGKKNVVSLLDNPSVRELGWVDDFIYERVITRAQRKDVVAYTMKMKEDHVKNLKKRQLPWITPTHSSDEDFVVGYSYGWPGEPKIDPLPLFGYQITDPRVSGNKLKVVIVGGNHAREDPACWALHGLVDFLVNDDPRAQTIRENVIFYVYPSVNPDGKQFLLSREHESLMTVNGSPELKAAGETNHNRLWNTEGRFVSIDLIKAAMHKDTGGSADYLLDFHGIPRLTFSFTDEKSVHSPLGVALLRRGMNFRKSSVSSGDTPLTLRSWSMSNEGVAENAFTPEIANQSKEALFLEGQLFALAFHDMINETERPVPHLVKEVLVPVQPKQPISFWLLDGNAENAVKDPRSPVSENAIGWSRDTPFSYPGNQSMSLERARSSIDFGRRRDLDSLQSMTVSLWVKGNTESAEIRYIISRYRPSEEQRSWAFVQTNLTEVKVILSTDGTHDGNKIKRHLSSLWPAKDIFDGTWRHLAFTYEAGKEGVLKLYVDGQELQPGSGLHHYSNGHIPGLFRAEANLRLGALGGEANSFQGQLDEIGIWDHALSPQEIQWLAGNSLKAMIE